MFNIEGKHEWHAGIVKQTFPKKGTFIIWYDEDVGKPDDEQDNRQFTYPDSNVVVLETTRPPRRNKDKVCACNFDPISCRT